MSATKDRTEYYQCKCHDVGCVVGVSTVYWEGTDKFPTDKDMAIYIQLSPYLPFYKRVYYGLRYMFNRTPQGYHWGETLIRDEDIPRLKAQIEEYENYRV